MERFARTSAGVVRTGFTSSPRRRPGQRRARALVQLLAAVGLVASLAVAVTAVSIEIAKAQATVAASAAR